MENLAPGISIWALKDTAVLFWGVSFVLFCLCVKSPFCSAAHASHFGWALIPRQSHVFWLFKEGNEESS